PVNAIDGGAESDHGFGFSHVPLDRGDVGAGFELRGGHQDVVEEGLAETELDFFDVFGDFGHGEFGVVDRGDAGFAGGGEALDVGHAAGEEGGGLVFELDIGD